METVLDIPNLPGVIPSLEKVWDVQGHSAGCTYQWQYKTSGVSFEGEMDEIADTFEEAGLPGEFHAAAVKGRRMAHFKEAASTPSLEAVLAALAGGEPES